MKDITVLLPIHELNEETLTLLDKSINSFKKNKETYTYGDLFLKIICPQTVYSELKNKFDNNEDNISFIINKDKTDFCSQINYGVEQVETEHFSILEYDDEYSPKWFNMVHEYYFSNEDVSVFLPINVQYDKERTLWQYCNELVWASSFSNELGFIDFECLENCSTFNLTGGVFNTNDFKEIGKFKPSINVAFNYELLLRLTNKKLKVFVVPKEGYYHLISRENSLTDFYLKTYSRTDIQKWFELAKSEYTFIEDRNNTISTTVEELK